MQKLLDLSSVTVEKLQLLGEYLLCEDHESINGYFTDFPKKSTFNHVTDLPPFTALTSLKIFVAGYSPTPDLVNALSSVSSVPALVSVTLSCGCWSRPGSNLSTTWDILDERLAQMAKDAGVKGDLVLTLARYPQGRTWEMLPKFGEVAKIIIEPLD